MTKENSTKIIHFMIHGAGFFMLGRVIIVNMHYLLLYQYTTHYLLLGLGIIKLFPMPLLIFISVDMWIRALLTRSQCSLWYLGDHCSQKKNGIKISYDMYIYTLCPWLLQSFTKFCLAVSEELRWPTVWSSIFHFGQISKFRKGVTPRKKLNQNVLGICTCKHYGLHNFKV